jgi:hypothetical protein
MPIMQLIGKNYLYNETKSKSSLMFIALSCIILLVCTAKHVRQPMRPANKQQTNQRSK